MSGSNVEFIRNVLCFRARFLLIREYGASIEPRVNKCGNTVSGALMQIPLPTYNSKAIRQPKHNMTPYTNNLIDMQIIQKMVDLWPER